MRTSDFILVGIIASSCLFVSIPRESAAMQQGSNVFWSGHSLTDPPIPQMFAEISAGFGMPMQWNRHSMAGASMEARTRGRPPNMNGWDGYQQGFNRDGEDMDVIEELRSAATVSGEPYGLMVITDVHDFLWWLQSRDSVRLLRHYHERFIEGNAAGQTFFYQSWLNVNSLQNPGQWIDYERAAAPVWQCIATRINASLIAEGRNDRIKFLPASLALVHLAERATQSGGVPGITQATTAETLNRIFSDGVHLTDTGSYYVALVSYAFTREVSPVGAWAPEGMAPDEAKALQSLAWGFYSAFRQTDRPLTLTECSALVRDSFAEHYWQYNDARAAHRENTWLAATWQKLRGPVRRRKNIAETQTAFADDNPLNPLRYDAATDAGFWHPAP